MLSFSSRANYIVQKFIRALPPSELGFRRNQSGSRSSYTLLIRQVTVGRIEIDNLPDIPFGACIHFTIIHNTFLLMYGGAEITVELGKLVEAMIQAIREEARGLQSIEVDQAAELDPLDVEDPPQASAAASADASADASAEPAILLDKTLYVDTSQALRRNRQPWEKIPDRHWDRLAVRLWCRGGSCQEIAERVHVNPRSVANRLSRLRKRYPLAGIPTFEQRVNPLLETDDVR